MAKFKKSGSKAVGSINTASLPDIVFMLLFFFMVTTVMREVELRVQVNIPGATEIHKLEKKSLVSYIYIGVPFNTNLYGTEPRIQLNDAFAEVNDIRDFIISERNKLDEISQQEMTVSLKIDEETKMGIVSDVKQALRRISALRINYSSRMDDSYLR